MLEDWRRGYFLQREGDSCLEQRKPTTMVLTSQPAHHPMTKGDRVPTRQQLPGHAEHFSACSPPGEGCCGFKCLLRYFRDVMEESAEVTTRHNTKRHNSFSKPSIVISPPHPPPSPLPPSLPPPSSVIGMLWRLTGRQEAPPALPIHRAGMCSV